MYFNTQSVSEFAVNLCPLFKQRGEKNAHIYQNPVSGQHERWKDDIKVIKKIEGIKKRLTVCYHRFMVM